MKRHAFRFLVIWTISICLRAETASVPSMWTPTTWHGERAFESVHNGWHAIVSVERSRLIHFGPSGSGENLLYAPTRRDDEFGWGGHRAWLGPQNTWPAPWPPPEAWEKHPAAAATAVEDRLAIPVPSAGPEWPAFTRVYRWTERGLICGVELQPGGSRAVQVVQIFQMPRTTQIVASLLPHPGSASGYVGLPVGRRPALTPLREPPPHAAIEGATMRLTHRGAAEKLGFTPHTLRGEFGGRALFVGRGDLRGTATGEPDEGFFTQVYLGSRDPFVELEQLSPLWRAGEPAVFEVLLHGK